MFKQFEKFFKNLFDELLKKTSMNPAETDDIIDKTAEVIFPTFCGYLYNIAESSVDEQFEISFGDRDRVLKCQLVDKG